MTNKDFMFWLRDFRRSRELSQDEFGKLLGITGPAVGRWESGESLPDPKQLRSLASVSGYSEIELFQMVGYLSGTDGDKNVIEKVALEHPLVREIVHEIQGLDDVGLRLIRDAIRWIFGDHKGKHFVERRDPSRSNPSIGRRATDKG